MAMLCDVIRPCVSVNQLGFSYTLQGPSLVKGGGTLYEPHYEEMAWLHRHLCLPVGQSGCLNIPLVRAATTLYCKASTCTAIQGAHLPYAGGSAMPASN